MFGIIKYSKDNKNMKPLCYFQNEKVAQKVFEGLKNHTDSRLLLVTDFNLEEKNFSKFPIIEEFRPPEPTVEKPKKIYHYENKYESRKKIVQESVKEKEQTKILIQKSNDPDKLPIDYYIKKDSKLKSPPEIYMFRYDLLDRNTNIIFVSKSYWPFEYDPNYVKIVRESPFYDGYYKITCYAKTKSEAEKLINSKLKQYFKKENKE